MDLNYQRFLFDLILVVIINNGVDIARYRMLCQGNVINGWYIDTVGSCAAKS